MLSKIISIRPDTVSGTPCFVGTRVPIKSLFDYLEAGDGLDEFLDQFPSVSRAAAIQLLENSRRTAWVSGPLGSQRRQP